MRSHFRLFVAGTSGARRVWLFTLVLAALTVCLSLILVPPDPPIPVPFAVPVWLIAAGFYLAEAKVIHLHIGRSAHSFSMSELPLVAGLFLVSPPAFIVARVIGSGLALYFNRRQRSVKLAFNLAQFSLASVVSVAIIHAAVPADGSFGPSLWIGVLVVALVENVIGVLSVSTAISLAEGTAQYRRIPEMLKIGIVVSLTNASIALMGLTVLWDNPGSAWLFVLPTITAALAYRAYISERQQHESIELLFESTRILQRSPQLDTAIVSLLEHARKMFRADVAEIRLLPRHEGDEVLRCQVGPGDAVVVMEPVGLALDDPILVRAVTERQAPPRRPGASRRSGRHDTPERPQGAGRAADRRVDARRHAPGVRLPERHQHVRAGRPQALRDAREPHGDRPRERPAGAVAGAARTAQGGAASPGLARPADRARQSVAVHPGRRLPP